MPSPNEAKLYELRKEALSMDDGYKAVCLAFVNRAFQLGRMEQHERDKQEISLETFKQRCYCGQSSWKTYTSPEGVQEWLCAACGRDLPIKFIAALAFVSPKETP